MSLLAFPSTWDSGRGTVHVMGSPDEGYAVSHESRSGDSWGGYETFETAQDAIAEAYRMARYEYGGADVSICRAALADVRVGSRWFGGDF